LEREAAALDAQIQGQLGVAKTRTELADKRRGAANAAALAAEVRDRRNVAATQAASNAAAHKTIAGRVETHRENVRCGLDRLNAAAAGHFPRLASIQEGIEALEFFTATHAARSETWATRIKVAESAKTAADRAHKAAVAELA